MATMDRTEYPGILQKIPPAQAVDVLNDRVRQVTKLNVAIADWLQERRRLEDQYAAALRKLARQQVDENDLGIFSVPWSTIAGSMDTLADSHSFLASKINTNVEKPLRDFATTNREMTAMTTIQGNLASLAKDVDRAQQKTDRLEGRGGKAEANKAPYVFETLQAIDESRVNQLRDLLTQFQTLEVDQVEKHRVAAEQCLNMLLNVETQDEIKTFAIKAASSSPPKPRARPTSMLPSALTPSRGAAASSSNALTPMQSIPDEESLNSESLQEKDKKGGLKGLKRLGTVISRRTSKQPAVLPSTPESPERRKSSPFNTFGRLGRSKGSYTLEPPQEEGAQRPRSPLRIGSEILEPSVSREEGRPLGRSPGFEPLQINGIPATSDSATATVNGSHQNDLADLEPPRPMQSDAPPTPVSRKDSEGFSIPPSNLDAISAAQAQAEAALTGESLPPQYNVNIRNAPIQEEGGSAALADVATKLQAPPVNTRRVGTVRGRRDGRNSYIQVDSPSSPPGPSIPPLSEEAETGLSKGDTSSVPTSAFPANSALAQSPSGILAPAGAPAVGFSSFSPPPEPQQSPFPTPSRTSTGIDGSGDNRSIRSGRSLTSTSSQPIKHPELTENGLNSSIIETVSARFENGKLATSSLIGEVALAYHPTTTSFPPGQDTIRLEKFSALEKVAPNPAFIQQTTDKEGEYTVSLANIAKTQVAFKYQLRLDESSSATPLLLAPAFKIEPNQTSVIINYSLHPSFALHGRGSLTLHNVLLALTLDGTKASSCLSKPVGTFAREKSLIYWQLGEITLTAGAPAEKLLARFATDGEARSGNVEAKWEITGEGADDHGSGLSVSILSQSGAAGASDPFADESSSAGAPSWKSVPAVKKLISGSYAAKS